MKSNAKRILSFVLVLLMSLSMVTGIVLPAAAADDASDPYAKITGTKDGVAIVPDANVYFVNPAWATAPAADGETFEYTYGDGTTWGNGKTYLLTWNVNAFAVLQNMHTLMTTLSANWVNKVSGAAQEMVVVVAPGNNSLNRNHTLTKPAEGTTPDKMFTVTVLGPQAGKNPVNDKRDSKAEVLKVQNGRSVDVTKEAVFNALVRPWGYANWTFDGFAATGAGAIFTAEANVVETNILFKNYYISGMTTGFQNAFIYMQTNTVATVEFKDSYLDLNQSTKAGTSSGSLICGNKFTFDNCAFVNGNYISGMANHIHWVPDRAETAAAHSAFYGTYATNPEFTVKNCVVADWDHINMFNFNTGFVAKSAGYTTESPFWTTYTGNAVKVNFEGNMVYDVNVNNAARGRMIHFNKIDTAAKAGSFELNITDNLFSFSDEKFAAAGSVHSVLYTDDTPNNVTIKSTIRENVVKSPNKNIVIPFWDGTTLKDGPLFDLSGNLFLDNAGNVLPVRSWHSQNSTTKYWKAQSDLYASDEMKGGIKELMSIKEVEDGVVTCTDIQLADRAADAAKKNYLQGRVTLILKDGKEYDADELFTFDDGVEFLGVYAEEACTTKVETVNKTNVHGKFAKAQYKTANTTLTVVYALYTPHTFLIVDPDGTYKTDGYTFNGVTYEDCKTADDGISAKFFTTIAEAYGTDGKNMPPFHVNTIDSLKTQSTTYTLEGIGERTYPYNYIGTGTVILLTPGEHVIGASASGTGNMALRKHVAIVGPQWGVSPYGADNAEGKLANGRSTNAATEALINGYFTPAADSGWINTFIDGVAFNGAGYAFNTSHPNPATMKTLYQAQVLKNCVFATTGSVVIGPETTAAATKILDLVIKDCAFDTSATDRRENANGLITARASVADIENIAILSKYCVADKNAALAKLTATPAAVRGWTPADNAQSVANVNFYFAEHAEELVTDYTTSTATCIKGGTATAKCPVCQATATVEVAATGKHEHDTTKWASDATNHFHACKTDGCTDVIDVTTHTESEVIVDKAATNIENGTAHTECTVCKRVMQSNIILPPTGGDAMLDLAKRFEAITATDENRDNILEPQGVIFVDAAFGKAPYTGTFEYTYGDGVTWGNGFTYTLTEGVNAYTKLVDAVLAVQAAWNAADTTVADYKGADTVVLAPATYSWDSWQPTKEIAYDLPTDFVKGNAYDKLFTVNFVGPQAGLSPVTDEIDHADPVQQNGRTADPTKEAVSTGTMWEPKNAYYIVDGMAFAKSHNYHGYASDGLKHPYTAMTLKNIYHQVDEFYAGGVFRFGLWGAGVEQSRYIEFTNYYIKYAQLTDPAKKSQTPTGEALTGDMIIFDNFYEDMTDIEYVTDQYAQGYQKNVYLTPTKYLVPGFAGEGVTGAHLIFKNSVINNHPTSHFMRFKLEGANYADAAKDSLNILFENNLFYNPGDRVRSTYASGNAFANDPATLADPGDYTDMISFQDDWAFPATSGALDFDFVGNTIEWTKEAMEDAYDGNGGTKKKTSGGNIFVINDNNWTDLASYAMENINQVKHGWDLRDTTMIIPTHELASKLYLTPTGGKASTAQSLAKINDSSSVLVLNENNEVCTWYVSNHLMMDIYASDTFAGGVRELFGVVNGADMAIADWKITINKSSNPSNALPTPGFEGTITIVPEVTAGTHNPEDLFNFRGDSVEFVELLDKSGNKVTGKVNPNDLDGYKVKARVLGNESVCNVTYTVAIAADSEYIFIDPTNSVTSYEFNGKTYTLNETNRFAKFDGTVSDKLVNNGLNVLVFLPGNHAFQGNQIKGNVAILGPGFGKDLMDENYNLTTQRGITKVDDVNYTVDTTKEALINGGNITIYRNEVSCFVDGIVMQNAEIGLMNINSYWWASSGSMHGVTLKNTFINGWDADVITGFDNSARGHVRLIEKGFVTIDEVYATGYNKSYKDFGKTNAWDKALRLVNAAAINTDINRLYAENITSYGLIRVGANNGLQMMNHPGTVTFSLTNSKIKNVTETWNMIYANFVLYDAKNQTWGGTPEANNDKAFPGGFKIVNDGNIFENNVATGTYLIRSGVQNSNSEYYVTNNTFIGNKSSGTAAFHSIAPAFMAQPGKLVIEGNLFINEPASGIMTGHYADLNETKLDISENYWATNDGTKDTVQLITVNYPKYTEKADWYYLDRAMTVRSCDVALVDNGYKAFEDKGFDGINNYVIDASESDQANLFKAVEGATVEGIYADAACTQEATAASGTVYVKVSKNGISLANKVELTACDHKDKGTEDKITKEPTCYQTGLKDVVCAACGTVLESGKEVAATGNHEWKTEWTITDTEHYKGCKTDGCTAKNEVGEHKESDTIVDEAPGCSSAGKGHTVCTVCEKVMNANVSIPSTGKHSPADDLVVDKAPTCYASGIGHSVCKDCTITLESNITIPATEAHNWATEWTITDNLHYYECTNDGCTFRNSAGAHTAGDIITDKAPSCYEAGYGHKDCTVCGKTMETNVEIPATGNHSWKNEWVQGDITHYHECSVEGCPAKGAENAHEKELITVIPETCGEAGLGKYVCKVCDVLLEDNVVIEPTGNHTKGGLEIYEGMEPNCGYTGLGYKSCTVCGQIVEDNIVIAIRGEHVPGAVVMDQAAGCTTAGKGHIDCTVCGKLLDNVVVAATHTPGEWASLQPGKEAQSCSVCGIILEIRDVLPEGSAPVDPAERFDDVDADDWYFEAVTFVVDEGLFNGTSDTEFSPNENMTRAMFVTVLGRLHGVKETKASTQFTDVKKSAYYSGYVAWAAKNSIVKGVSDTKFAPDANITREQIAVMMVRYMDFAKISAKKINTKITFKDASSISGYAKSAVATCQTGGIVNGIKVSGGYKFNPKANATRAQVATIMMNFCENYK